LTRRLEYHRKKPQDLMNPAACPGCYGSQAADPSVGINEQLIGEN